MEGLHVLIDLRLLVLDLLLLGGDLPIQQSNALLREGQLLLRQINFILEGVHLGDLALPGGLGVGHLLLQLLPLLLSGLLLLLQIVQLVLNRIAMHWQPAQGASEHQTHRQQRGYRQAADQMSLQCGCLLSRVSRPRPAGGANKVTNVQMLPDYTFKYRRTKITLPSTPMRMPPKRKPPTSQGATWTKGTKQVWAIEIQGELLLEIQSTTKP